MKAKGFRIRSAILVLVLSLLGAHPLRAQEWPRFRGPNGSGVSSVQGLPTAWTGKDYLWKASLAGVGHSSPVLWGKKLFLTSGDAKNERRVVQCLSADTGKELWVRTWPVDKHRQHADNSWASATPAVDERQIYLAWASPKDYLVIALDHEGQEKWRVELGGFQSGHGFGVSPIVHDGLLVVPCEHEGKSFVLGLETKDGAVRWKLPRKSKTTYSTPCVFQSKEGKAELIFVNYEHGVASVDPAAGKVNWEMDVFDKGHIETSIASPIVAGDLILASSGWLGVRMEVIALNTSGLRLDARQGQPKREYTLTKGAPLVPTPLVKGDLLFLWNDDGIVTCADVGTGKVHWRERVPGDYYGSPICAGEHLYAVSKTGDVVVVKAAATFEHVATNALGEGSHSTPACAGNTLYLRTFRQVMAVGKK